MGKTSPRARVAPSSSKSFTTPTNSMPRRRSVDVLTPQVPPVYPSAPRPSPLSRDAIDKVTHYKKYCQYVCSNYSVHVPRKANSYAFNVHRYTDTYNNSLLVKNTDIVPRIGIDRLPEELACPSKHVRRGGKVKETILKKSLDDLGEDEESQKEEEETTEGGEPPAKKPRETAAKEETPLNENFDEEEMDDADEELDMGTDYFSSYFDNGEDFIDSDREGDDDGPVY